MRLTPDNIKIIAHTAHSTSIGWTQGEHRFHVWMKDGELGDTIFHNIDNEADRMKRTTHMKLDSHPHVRLAIAALPAEGFKLAEELRLQKEEARTAQVRDEAIADLHDRARTLGFKLVPLNGANE